MHSTVFTGVRCSQACVLISFIQSCLTKQNLSLSFNACGLKDASFISNNFTITCYQSTCLPACGKFQTGVFFGGFQSFCCPLSHHLLKEMKMLALSSEWAYIKKNKQTNKQTFIVLSLLLGGVHLYNIWRKGNVCLWLKAFIGWRGQAWLWVNSLSH